MIPRRFGDLVDAAFRDWLALVGGVIVDLEHGDMTEDLDRRFQRVCADLADLIPDTHDDELWARLARAAMTCHHCAGDR